MEKMQLHWPCGIQLSENFISNNALNILDIIEMGEEEIFYFIFPCADLFCSDDVADNDAMSQQHL